jgi:hypothetical protein
MVHETVTMEGHLIDSDILRRAFARIVEDGGEFEVQEFKVGKTNDDPSFVRLSVTAPDPEHLDRILEALSYLGRRRWWPTRASPSRGRRHPARRVLLDDELRHPRPRGRALGGAPGSEDGLRAGRARRRAALREAGPGEEGRARGPARPRHPRPSARAQPRLLGLRFHVQRGLGRGQQGHRHRGHGPEMRKAREAGEKIVVVAGPPSCIPAAMSRWPAWCGTAGWTCCSRATPSRCTTWRSRSSRRAWACAR